MPFADTLIHRCTTQRSTPASNPLGEDVDGAAANVLTNEPCRLVIRSQRVLDTEMAQEPRVTTYDLLFRPGRDVQEGDRIINVTYPDATVIPEVFSIEAVMPRWDGSAEHHITCELKRLS